MVRDIYNISVLISMLLNGQTKIVLGWKQTIPSILSEIWIPVIKFYIKHQHNRKKSFNGLNGHQHHEPMCWEEKDIFLKTFGVHLNQNLCISLNSLFVYTLGSAKHNEE